MAGHIGSPIIQYGSLERKKERMNIAWAMSSSCPSEEDSSEQRNQTQTRRSTNSEDQTKLDDSTERTQVEVGAELLQQVSRNSEGESALRLREGPEVNAAPV